MTRQRLRTLGGCVIGAITLTSGVLTIRAELAGPLEVVAGLEVGPAGFALATGALLGVFASVIMPTVAQWYLARWPSPRRRFRELAPAVRTLRHVLFEHTTRSDDDPDPELDQAFDVEIRLQRLGISILAPGNPADYAVLIELAERGAWREARRKFPTERRPCPGPERSGCRIA